MNLIIINTQLFDSQNINGLESCGLLVDFCDVFISGLDSFWRHPFTADNPLVRKWCNATFLQICSDEETNSSVSWMAWVNWLNYSLKRFFFKNIKELFGLRQWFATSKRKPCFSLSCSFTWLFCSFYHPFAFHHPLNQWLLVLLSLLISLCPKCSVFTHALSQYPLDCWRYALGLNGCPELSSS